MHSYKNIFEQHIIVSAYCRVSTDKDDQANSLDSQIKYFTDFIKNHKTWQLGEIYYDEGLSGTSVKKRKAFNRMIQDGLNGKFHLIITKEVSRFARNTVDTLQYTRTLKDKNVGVYFMTDNICTLDSDGELRLTIMASIAQEESRKTSERVKWGQRRRMEQGVVFGNGIIYGYFLKNGKLSINPEEAKTIKFIFTSFLEGHGIEKISTMLDDAGYKTKWGKRWYSRTVYDILKNEKYVGDLVQKKKCTPNFLTKHRIMNPDQDDLIIKQNTHEGIVSREIWNQVQLEIERRSTSSERKIRFSSRYWCSGKVVCGDCGDTYTSVNKNHNTRKKSHYFSCKTYARRGTKKVDEFGKTIGCDNRPVQEYGIRYIFQEALRFVEFNKDEIKKEILQELRLIQQEQELKSVENFDKKIKELEHRKIKSIDLVFDGVISNENLKKLVSKYDEEIAELNAKKIETELYNHKLSNRGDFFSSLINEIDKILLLELEEERIESFNSILEKIVVFSNKTMLIYLSGLGFGIKAQYKTTGGYHGYNINVESINIEEIA
ncbi:MAG: recombinase family protein [Firmicutes bacterium]|nr:recombinase family protein [Bacillota bacterium]